MGSSTCLTRHGTRINTPLMPTSALSWIPCVAIRRTLCAVMNCSSHGESGRRFWNISKIQRLAKFHILTHTGVVVQKWQTRSQKNVETFVTGPITLGKDSSTAMICYSCFNHIIIFPAYDDVEFSSDLHDDIVGSPYDNF